MQGYLVDKASAEKFGITNINDFKKPEIKEAFDSNGDGKRSRWLELRGQDRGATRICAHIQGRLYLGDGRPEPILFYTWTPNWTVGILKPGEDVVWIEMPRDRGATHSDIKGCVNDPCALGWEANDIRPLANNGFLAENPAIETLLRRASRSPISSRRTPG